MTDEAEKPVVVKDFDAGGKKYRAEELKSGIGVKVTDLASGKSETERWPPHLRDALGSEASVDITIQGVQSVQDGAKRYEALQKALEAERKRRSAVAQPPAP